MDNLPIILKPLTNENSYCKTMLAKLALLIYSYECKLPLSFLQHTDTEKSVYQKTIPIYSQVYRKS